LISDGKVNVTSCALAVFTPKNIMPISIDRIYLVASFIFVVFGVTV
jgi:hypothetical protein